MAADIIQHSWDAMAAQVLRACTHDAAHLTHGDRHERRILEMGDPDSDIDALLDKVHDAIDEQRPPGATGPPIACAVRPIASRRAMSRACGLVVRDDDRTAARLGILKN